jgi:adenylate cyclase class IV
LARNVELKVRCDAEALTAIEGRLRDDGHEPAELHQVDTYLSAAHGRLKVRETHSVEGNSVELIAYDRPDLLGTRLSDYRRVAVDRSEGAGLLAALRAALDQLVVVEKVRRVAILGRTRVHLDRVTGLGCFIELETVLADGDDEATGRAEAAEVASLLGIDGLTPIAGSYSDLLLARSPVEGDPDADR